MSQLERRIAPPFFIANQPKPINPINNDKPRPTCTGHSQPRPDIILDVKGAAVLLGVCPKTIQRLCKKNEIPHKTLGRVYRFSQRELLGWLRNRL